MKKKTDWWHNFFPDFRPLFDLRQPKTTNAEVRYLIKKFNLIPGSEFLDCPCGIGRIALPLARKGIRVTGVDITPSYLKEVASKAKRRGLSIELHEEDMRLINFNNRFDAAANLWTSFGYFEKESDNQKVLKRAYRALKPGGKFLLHLINRDWLLVNFQSSDWCEVGGFKLLENREFDYKTSTSSSVWCFLKDGRETSHQVSIRHYSFHELIAMFTKAGFIDIEGYGSTEEEPISRNSRMMFVFGTKPKA